MKNIEKIEKRIVYLDFVLADRKSQLSTLNQIDCLSSEGSNLRKEIAEIRGELEGLIWVINK